MKTAALVFAVAAALALPRAAADAAESIDFTRPLLDIDCHPLPSSAAKDAKPMTLYDLASASLLLPDQYRQPQQQRGPAQPDSPDQKRKEFELAVKITVDRRAIIDSDELALLKKDIGESQSPLLMGRAFEILDPDPKNPGNCAAAGEPKR